MTVSPETEREIKRQMAAGGYATPDELLSEALSILSGQGLTASEHLRNLVIEAKRTPAVDFTLEDYKKLWDEIENEELP